MLEQGLPFHWARTASSWCQVNHNKQLSQESCGMFHHFNLKLYCFLFFETVDGIYYFRQLIIKRGVTNI